MCCRGSMPVPPPESVETSLQLKEAPLANTSRYDGLRGVDEVVTDMVEVNHALMSRLNSKSCGCTAWPAPGRI